MANWIWRSKKENDEGFSLVELLIVVIIMGVLAAIAIPLFLSQRAKAEDAKTEALVETMGKELATWWTDHFDGDGPEIAINDDVFHVWDDAADEDGTEDETIVTPLPRGFTDADDWWEFSGTDKTDWCFAAFNEDGKNHTYVVTATGGLRSVPGGDGDEASDTETLCS